MSEETAAAPVKLRFIEDPGHGWLEVPAAEIRRLEITDKISTFSYVSEDGAFAYLEEDCDFSVYVRAKEARGEEWRNSYKAEHQANTFVRNLNSYAASRLAPADGEAKMADTDGYQQQEGAHRKRP